MFPTLNYLINYLFGTELSLEFPPSFGTLVALSFIAAAWVLMNELKRKESLGLVQGKTLEIEVGKPASPGELAGQFALGFVLGLKLVGAYMDADVFRINPQAYLLSTQGSLIGGLLGGALFAFLRYRDKQKKALPKPEKKKVLLRPYEMTGSITIAAAISGLIGAKIFHQLEYFDQFIQDPIGNLISASGLTFYGGLIGGFLGVWWFARRQKLKLIHIADAVAPGLILAYALGRIGCGLSGDGDWGIVNSAYRITEDRTYVMVSKEDFETDIRQDGVYRYFAESPQEVDHAYYPKPQALSFLPDWLFAFDFPHNVNREGIPMPECQGTEMTYCSRLPMPVFPTMVYETIMGLLIFLVLWFGRKRWSVPGQIFMWYLMLNGLERFAIEQIRVNSEMQLLGITLTQAELIGALLFAGGLLGIVFIRKLSPWLQKL